MTEKLVYFMRPVGHIGPIKIGCSKEPEGRLMQLAIVSPLRLEIIVAVAGTHADERRLHGMFAKHWLHHEWFEASRELLALVDYAVANNALPTLPEGKVVPLPRRKLCGLGAGGKRPPTQKSIAFGALVRAEYEAGEPAAKIAEKHGCQINKVIYCLRAIGVEIRRKGPANPPKGVVDTARADDFAQRYHAGATLQQIADIHGLTRERVRQILRKTGVDSIPLSTRRYRAYLARKLVA